MLQWLGKRTKPEGKEPKRRRAPKIVTVFTWKTGKK